jgi:hypothetical protein
VNPRDVDELRPALGAGSREQDRDALAHALEHVAVAGEEQRAAAGRHLGLGEAAKQVVGLQVARVQRRPAEGAEERRRALPLPCQLVGHRRPVGVVAGVQLDPVGRGFGAEAHDHGARRMALDGLQHEVRATQQSVDRVSVAVGYRARQREERAVQQRGGVDGDQRSGDARTLSLKQRAAMPIIKWR